jgi:hypothetical protein
MFFPVEDFVQSQLSAPEILASESLVPENPAPGFPESVGMGFQAVIVIAPRFLDGRIDGGAPGAQGMAGKERETCRKHAYRAYRGHARPSQSACRHGSSRFPKIKLFGWLNPN